jgi:hypothetical protein
MAALVGSKTFDETRLPRGFGCPRTRFFFLFGLIAFTVVGLKGGADRCARALAAAPGPRVPGSLLGGAERPFGMRR